MEPFICKLSTPLSVEVFIKRFPLIENLALSVPADVWPNLIGPATALSIIPFADEDDLNTPSPGNP